jgi:formylmethanofuran dehydrogenase subunit C
MTALRLTLRAQPDQRLDLSPLTPGRLAGLDAAAIEALPLHTTRHRVTVGDIFEIHPGDPAEIVIEGGSERFDRVGEAMQTGTLTVQGDVGQQAGRLLAGGTLLIHGNTGGWAASGQRGGTLEIAGNGGAFLGGPLAGERTGMRGGVVLVRGSVGPRVADRLRRGLVVVEGDAGDYAGSGMFAGTLVVCGGAGALPGILMRRGTIVLGKPADLSPSFVSAGRVEMVFTTLLARAAAAFSEKAAACVRSAVTRYAGDTAVLGKGELFVAGDIITTRN